MSGRVRNRQVNVRVSDRTLELWGAIAQRYAEKFQIGSVSQADVVERLILKEAKALGLLEASSDGKERGLAVDAA